MVTVQFQNVGQGDSILIEWSKNSKKYIGIIDCNIYNGRNPTLDYIKQNSTSHIEFVVLSHFHYDHFSGMADLFEHCVTNKIKVKYFYHSMAPFLGEIYDRIFTSQKIQAEVKKFVEKFEDFDDVVENNIPVSPHIAKIELSDKVYMSFLAPAGNVYHKMAKQLSRKINKVVTTNADINKLSTIILIENTTNCILLTADSVKNNFKRITISPEILLAQVPHHGSWASIYEPFWQNLKKTPNCPAVFSVGDEPKDKLPNFETVEFIDKTSYKVHSTNAVYGISTFYSTPVLIPTANSKSLTLNSFSKLKSTYTTLPPSSVQYNGDQKFSVL